MLGKLFISLIALGTCATLDCTASGQVNQQVISYIKKSDKEISLSISSPSFMQQWKPEKKQAWVIAAVSLSRLIEIEEQLEKLFLFYNPTNTVILYDEQLEPFMKDFAPEYQKFNLALSLSEGGKRTFDILTGEIKPSQEDKQEVIFLSNKIYKEGEMP